MSTLTVESFQGRLLTQRAIRDYVLAGNAYLTVRSHTGTRFTFHVRKVAESSAHPGVLQGWKVEVLTGSNNRKDYTPLGRVWGDGTKFCNYRRSPDSRIGAEAPSAQAFVWLWAQITGAGTKLGQAEVWHEGRCGVCGRPLTDPESIASGIGPICQERG